MKTRFALLALPLLLAAVPATRALAQIEGRVIIQAPAPAFVEEGSVINGTVVVAPPGPIDYVFIDGSYYYWQPELRVWVHAHRDHDWRPPGGVHIYHHWDEHPMYHRGDRDKK